MRKKIIIWCLLFVMLVCAEMKVGLVNVQAANMESTQLIAENAAKYNSGGIVTKYYEVNTSAKAIKLVVTVPEYTKDQVVSIALCNSQKQLISEFTEITSASQKVKYFLRGDSKYYIRAYTNDSGLKIEKKKTTLTASSGKSFSNATTIKAGDTKEDVIGYNNGTDTKQYYKIKVDKEKLVQINIKKSESSGELDKMNIYIYYKSTNKNELVETGHLYEGQKSAYMLIRNSSSKKTLPGTYYIVVSKTYSRSGFQYSISY